MCAAQVAEEKRQLYKKIGKHVLKAEESHYRHDVLDKQRDEELLYGIHSAPSPPSLSRSIDRKASPPPRHHRDHHQEHDHLEGTLQRDVQGLDLNIGKL